MNKLLLTSLTGYSVALLLFFAFSFANISVLPLLIPVIIIIFYWFMRFCDIIQFWLCRKNISTKHIGGMVWLAACFLLITLFAVYTKTNTTKDYLVQILFAITLFVLISLSLRFVIKYAKNQFNAMKNRIPR